MLTQVRHQCVHHHLLVIALVGIILVHWDVHAGWLSHRCKVDLGTLYCMLHVKSTMSEQFDTYALHMISTRLTLHG